MGIFDWLGPTAWSKRRGWDALPAVPTAQKAMPPGPILTTTGEIGYWTPTTTAARLSSAALGAGNSAVFACLQSIASAVAEPPLRVYRSSGVERVDLEASPLAALIAKPNPVFSLDTLLAYLAVSLHVEGNAYWRKLRSGHPLRGNVVELWPIAPTRIYPTTAPGSSDFITAYQYTAVGGRTETIDPQNIVHVRYGLDDADHRLGCSPLKRLVAEISSDAQATRYADRLLANLAINGLTLSFDKEAPVITQEQADALKARLAATFGGDNAGAAAVLSPGAQLSALGFSPEQMDLKVLHRVPEERISAVLGVPAIVAGLGAGLDRSTYSNYQEASRAFVLQKLIPLWRLIAGEITLQLVPDFTPDETTIADFDLDDIRALADDENAKAVRLKALVDGGILTTDEARAELGYPPLPDGAGAAPRLAAVPPSPTPPAGPDAVAASRRVARSASDVMLKAEALGAPLALSEGDLDRMSRLSDDDLPAAERFWREAIDGTGLEDLLDATPDEED